MIAYEFMQYSLKHRLKELGTKGQMAVTKDLSQLHTKDNLFTKLANHLTKEQKQEKLNT